MGNFQLGASSVARVEWAFSGRTVQGSQAQEGSKSSNPQNLKPIKIRTLGFIGFRDSDVRKILLTRPSALSSTRHLEPWNTLNSKPA